MSELPTGWALSTLGEVCGQPEQRIPTFDEEFTYIDIGSIDRDLKVLSAPKRLLGGNAPSRARKVVEAGDVLVSMIRPNLNAVALVGEQHHEGIASSGFDILKPINVEPRWIFAAVRSARFIETMCDKVQGALYPAIKPADIRGYEIPLPSLAEQIKICQILDQLLTQTNTLKSRIDAIPTLIKRFRQSALSAAVSGQLTEEWRKLHAEQGQITAISVDGLPPNWRTDRLDTHFSAKNGKAFPSSAYQDNGVKLIRPGNLHISGEVSWSQDNTVCLNESYAEDNARHLISKGAIVMNLTAQSLKDDFLGRACIFLDDAPALLNQRQCTFEPTTFNKIESSYLFIYFRSPQFRNYVDTLDSGSLIKHMYTKQLAEHEISIPPRSEQVEITRRIEQLFKFADQLESKISATKNHINKLPQSIFSKAFKGELTVDWRTKNQKLIDGEDSGEALLKKIINERKKNKNRLKLTNTGNRNMAGKAKIKEIITVFDALKESGAPLTGQQLLAAAGYPIDSSTEQLEQFFLDIRNALNHEQIVKQSRDRDGQDWFALAEAK